jgi:hypothetical protein
MNKQKLIELRCKAWGITEDEYYCNQCSDFSLEDMARAYRRGKNKGKAETALLSQHILDLQKDKGNLTDRVRELEQQIEKMKCCYNCSKWKDGQCADVPNDNSYYSADFVCEDWEIKEND